MSGVYVCSVYVCGVCLWPCGTYGVYVCSVVVCGVVVSCVVRVVYVDGVWWMVLVCCVWWYVVACGEVRVVCMGVGGVVCGLRCGTCGVGVWCVVCMWVVCGIGGV